ncbi:8-amino-7-oxononanoate synthase [Salmonella enterica subsp. enterica]|uniref:8-amino-7-oxononanoate synthase n=1 Tax=Salmonella enterica I TaxID=59201 RepID=A0A3S4F8L8_SALET|nr:8-amino-7-oxononanoate synthase [Salmonella enterica subsp. enterica]
MSWQQRVDDALTARRATDTLRRRYVVSQGAGRWLVANGRQYLNFSSNDYLGLSQHPQIIRAWQQQRRVLASAAAGRVISAVIPWRTRR